MSTTGGNSQPDQHHSDPYSTSAGNSPLPPAASGSKGMTRRRRPESMLLPASSSASISANSANILSGTFSSGVFPPASPNPHSATLEPQPGAGGGGGASPPNPFTQALGSAAGKGTRGGAGKDGKGDGHGCFAYSDGTVYEGEWLDEKQHGHGVCLLPSGNIYVGEWNHGVIEGRGTMLYSDSDLFEGQWKAGACDGEGVFFSSGTETRGVWSKGQKVSGRTVKMSEDNAASAALRYQTITSVLKSVSSNLFFDRTSTTGGGNTTPKHASGGSSRLQNLSLTAAGGGHTPPQERDNYQQQQHTPGQQALRPNSSPGDASITGGDSTAGGGTTIERSNAKSLMVLDPAVPQNTNSRKSRMGGPASAGMDGNQSTMIEMQGLAQAAATGAKGGEGQEIVGGINTGEGTATKTRPDILFSVAGPAYTSSFDLGSWFKYFGIFMFPYLSLPHCRCPLRVNVLDLEREYVVSGAALHMSFEQPTTAVYCALVAVTSSVLALIGADYMDYDVTDKTRVARVDLAAPFVSLFLFAAMNAGYHSFTRVAHALERVDRKTFPRLASFAASCVDSQSGVCIYTWGEDGNSKVTNKHYRYRWLAGSILLGLGAAFLSPIYRGILGEQSFGNHAIETFVIITSMVAGCAVFAGITFYVLKLTDMERQVLGQMRVISRVAYVSGVSLLRPTDHRKMKFNLEAPLYTGRLTEGFVGWYVTRCFVLYASTCANHSSRSAAMSSFFLGNLILCLITFGDLLYAFILEYDHTHYSVAHAIGLFVALTWGLMCLRYLYVAVMIELERKKHLYIVDTAALIHQSSFTQGNTTLPMALLMKGGGNVGSGVEYQGAGLQDPASLGSLTMGGGGGGTNPASMIAGPDVVSLCRSMITHHDYKGRLLGIQTTPAYLFVVTMLIMGQIGVLSFWLVYRLSN